MRNTGNHPSRFDLSKHSLDGLREARWNLTEAQLVERAIQQQEGHLTSDGALVVKTGKYTGRSPRDRFIVCDETTESAVDWGAVNKKILPEQFERLYDRIKQYLNGKEVFVQDCFGGAHEEYALPIRVVSELAWHSLFAKQLFVRPDPSSTSNHNPEFTVVCVPGVTADPATDGTNSEAFICLSFTRKMVIIGGTLYAGEMKKAIFSVLNFLLPERGVFPMHCSANVGADDQSALFFGLSGTGKTTLSADPDRRLVGDDEHGWSDTGIFNFEGGCYAKCIRLSKENEPQIWSAIRFGAVVENVVYDPSTRIVDFDDASITENTRVAYPVEFIDNALVPGVAGHPSNVVFLTADAFGVLPPVSRLTPDQAMYHFMSGYTAKVAGTERGLGNEPAATFSACFGSPFLPRKPSCYAEMLGARLRKHQATCWLVNTGWVGGGFGVGKRMDLPYTRAMLAAALSGALDNADFVPHPIFGVTVPRSCPGVPGDKLDPRAMWADSATYDEAAVGLSRRFQENFAGFSAAPEQIRQAGPTG